MHCKSLILFLAGFSAAVGAGIPVELQEKKADGLNGWSRGAEKIVRFVEAFCKLYVSGWIKYR